MRYKRQPTGEQYERVVEKALARFGLATYTRPKVQYHSRDMFNGDVLFVYKNQIYVIQCKKYQDLQKGLSVGKKALLNTLTNPKLTNHYFVFVSTPFNDMSILCHISQEHLANTLAINFGGAVVETFEVATDEHKLIPISIRKI